MKSGHACGAKGEAREPGKLQTTHACLVTRWSASDGRMRLHVEVRCKTHPTPGFVASGVPPREFAL